MCERCIHYKVCQSIDDGVALCYSGGNGCEHYVATTEIAEALAERLYCCDIKEYCDHNPQECPIAKRNKDIAEIKNAENELIEAIKDRFNPILDKIEKILRGVINGIKS